MIDHVIFIQSDHRDAFFGKLSKQWQVQASDYSNETK